MAIHVSTWDEFVSAVTAATAQEIYVDADLDASDWESSRINVTGGTIVHGQGHSVRNIIFNHSTHLFLGMYGDIEFSDLDFVNVMDSHTGEDDCAFVQSDNNYNFTFKNCRFQGRFVNLAFKRLRFKQCTFAFANGLYYALWSGGALICDECYFDFGTQTMNHTPLIYAESGSIALNNCYFKGTILATNKVFKATLNNSVVNVFCAPTSELFTMCDNAESISLYNTDRITGTPEGVQNVVGLSDTELKNAESVIDTGFPIVT